MLTVVLNPRTIKKPVRFAGQGLFAPVHCSATVFPAAPGSGITMRRTDLADQPLIRADARHVYSPTPESNRDAARHTVLLPAPGRTGVHTVEHLLSALWGLGLTDAHVDVNGPEVPMLDASALPFAMGLIDAGIAEPPQSDTRFTEPIIITEPIEIVGGGGARILAEPADGPALQMEYTLDYGSAGGPVLARQSTAFAINWQHPDTEGYLTRVAPARTFCTDAEAAAFKAAGFFAHLAPGEVLIAGSGGPVDTTLRLDSEPAVHKLLDMIGDLALSGRPVFAKVTAYRSGHTLNHAMARALMSL